MPLNRWPHRRLAKPTMIENKNGNPVLDMP